MDNVAGVASGSEQDPGGLRVRPAWLIKRLSCRLKYHPKLVYNWSISSDKLPFLDIYMTPRDDRISTSIYYKDTDSHSYLNLGSSYPSKCKSSIPYNQFLRLRKICSEDDVFQKWGHNHGGFFCCTRLPPWPNYKSTSPSGRKTETTFPLLTHTNATQEPPRGGTAIYGLYRCVPLWRVWFSSSLLWDRVYKSESLGLEESIIFHVNWSIEYRSVTS